MNNLLDTHTFIWYFEGSDKLSKKAVNSIDSSLSTNYISIASFWEIAIKKSLNKLDLSISFEELEKTAEQYSIKILPINFADTVLLSQLPLYHNYPFDRMLISQAITNNLSIITKDIHFKNYNVNLIW